MLKQNNIFNKDINIFYLFIVVAIINLLSAVHFVPIMLGGIVYIAFDKVVKEKNVYTLFWIILSFFIIENIQGLETFSLLLISFFIYLILKAQLQSIFSSSGLVKSLYVLVFYILLITVHSAFNGFNPDILLIISINILIDIFIVGFFV